LVAPSIIAGMICYNHGHPVAQRGSHLRCSCPVHVSFSHILGSSYIMIEFPITQLLVVELLHYNHYNLIGSSIFRQKD